MKPVKPENRYSKAISQIRPDPDFINETIDKLERSNQKMSFTRFALPAVALLVVIALAAGFLPNMLGAKNSAVTEPSPTPEQYAALPETDDAARSNTTPMPTPMPTPLATLIPNGSKAASSSYSALTEEAAWDTEEGFWAYESYYYPEFNTEEYSFINESGYRFALTNPLSTFAADVDTAGYTTVRRRLLSDRLPDQDAVRIEEILNYFRYKGLAPEDGASAAISAYLSACPWNEDAALMFVGIGAKQIETSELPPSNLVFLIDTSGSMDGKDRLDLAKRAFYLLADTLREGDTVSIVTYSGSFKVILEGVDAKNRGDILSAVDSLEAYGSTNGGDAIVTAYGIAQKYFVEGGNNRVIMMTDGDLNVGITSESELVNLIEEKKNSGVFLSVLGFGVGNYKDSKLEALADHGNGVYSYIDGINEARRVLVTEMGANFYTVAKDVKIQVEFNPEYVSAYRLVGYENRALAAEDFADDTKDGGEMGSGHTVVALYELIPAEGQTIAGVTGKAGGNTGVDLKYQQAQTLGIEEICQVSIRYKQPDGDTSEIISRTVTPDDIAEGDGLRNVTVAAAAAEFGLMLRDSEYKGSAGWDSAAGLLKGLSDLSDDEAELLYLITRAKAMMN